MGVLHGWRWNENEQRRGSVGVFHGWRWNENEQRRGLVGVLHGRRGDRCPGTGDCRTVGDGYMDRQKDGQTKRSMEEHAKTLRNCGEYH